MRDSMKTAIQMFRATNPRAHFAAKVVNKRISSRTVPPRALFDKKDEEATVGELYLYDAIGADWFGGIGARDVVAALKDMEASGVTELHVYINSPGGDVFEGVAIYNAIARFKGTKRVYIDGLAASAASFIAMVGDSITTAFNAMWMVHQPWGLVIGNAAQMRDTAEMLDKVAGTLVDTYVKRTKQSAADVTAWMDAETWMTAAEAKEHGFTDFITEEDEEEDEEEEITDVAGASVSMLTKFKNTPTSLRPAASSLLATMEQRVMNLPPRASPPSQRGAGQPGSKKQ